MARRFTPGHVQIVQTDGGPQFKGEFAQAVCTFCERHRLARPYNRPYKKNEQSYIESFNRARCAKHGAQSTVREARCAKSV